MVNLDAKAELCSFGDVISAGISRFGPLQKCRSVDPMVFLACWSVKGKQIVCGRVSGDLVQYTPDGQPKASVPVPPTLEGLNYAGTLFRCPKTCNNVN
jgi:hypothetical protein